MTDLFLFIQIVYRNIINYFYKILFACYNVFKIHLKKLFLFNDVCVCKRATFTKGCSFSAYNSYFTLEKVLLGKK